MDDPETMDNKCFDIVYYELTKNFCIEKGQKVLKMILLLLLLKAYLLLKHFSAIFSTCFPINHEILE